MKNKWIGHIGTGHTESGNWVFVEFLQISGKTIVEIARHGMSNLMIRFVALAFVFCGLNETLIVERVMTATTKRKTNT